MDIAGILRATALFKRLHPAPLEAIAAICRPVELPAGRCLMTEGEPSDALYVVVSGRIRTTASGPAYPIDLGRHEFIGEIGVAANTPRMRTAHAIRDSVVLEMQGLELLAALQPHPGALFVILQAVVRRMQRYITVHHGPSNSPIKTLSVIELAPGEGAREFSRRLITTLAERHEVRVITAKMVDAALGEGAANTTYADADGNRKLVRWLAHEEQQHDLLVFHAGSTPSEWWNRCLRQADTVLLLGNAANPQVSPDMQQRLNAAPQLPTRELILQRTAHGTVGDVMSLRRRIGASAHHYWQPGSATEIDAIVRQLTGHGIGVVLGGGGARGFAHIGLARALGELNIPVDIVGGSSMGAFVAALWARSLSPREMVQVCRDLFVDHNRLNDYTLPRVSLIRGRRFFRALREVFGDQRIEEMWHSFYCVSTNLTAGRAHVHGEGDLATWLAASMCIPGVAPPIGWNGDFYADGGIVNNLPTDVMHGRGRGPVLACSVNTSGAVHCEGFAGPDPGVLYDWPLETPRPTLFEILTRTATLTSESGMARRAELADVFIQMPVPKVGMFGWGQIDALVRLGYEHAMDVLLESRAILLHPAISLTERRQSAGSSGIAST
ncbi:MAG: patatin-like phospholipase family protein [Oceanococcaceae bacterium]